MKKITRTVREIARVSSLEEVGTSKIDFNADYDVIILQYAKLMSYGMSINERNQKWDDEKIEFDEAIDLNIVAKLEEEGADVQITSALRQIASGINPKKALIKKIKADLKKRGISYED